MQLSIVDSSMLPETNKRRCSAALESIAGAYDSRARGETKVGGRLAKGQQTYDPPSLHFFLACPVRLLRTVA